MKVSDLEMPMKKRIIPREYAELEAIEIAAGAIFTAKHPVVLVGSGAIRANAGNAVTQLAEKLHIPVINTMMAKGIIPFDNKYSMWTIGIPQKDYVNKIIENADLVVTIGYDIVEYSPNKWNANRDKKIIHIDQRPAHINKYYQPEVDVVGEIASSLERLAKRVSEKEEPVEAFKIKEAMVNEHNGYENDTSFPMKPQKVLIDLRKAIGHDGIVISDVGAHKMWIARHYNCYLPNTCIISNGFASMGIAIPGAIVAKLLNPNKRVIAVCGDGGFMMNCQEMETAFRIGTPIVVLIFNDSSYGLIKWKQQDQYGQDCFVDFGNPDFVKFAESMNCKGYRIEKAEDLEVVLEEAFQQKVPSIIDCRVDYEENTKLTKHLEKIYQENNLF
jgi:acetolactate synthase-1/2/3 large subunit